VSSGNATLVALQAWLHATAAQDRRKRFRLFNVLVRSSTLAAAVPQLSKAKGRKTPGVDGVTFKSLAAPGAWAKLLCELQQSIKNGVYEPSPLRRTTVPKPDGRRRVLGIPTIIDRVVQHALLLLLTPIVEAELAPVTFACRPGLGPHHALRAVEEALERAPRDAFIIRADIEAFYDAILHAALLDLLRRRLQGQKLISLVWSQITAWAKYKRIGIAQGAPLSPLLANWFLSDVDWFFVARSTCAYIRYMDDIFIVVAGGRARADECLKQLGEKLAVNGLKLSAKKTRVASIRDGAEFLGLHARRDEKNAVEFKVSPKSIAALRGKIAASAGDKNIDNKKITAATAAWLAYFSQYDEEAGLEAVRYFEERTGIRGPCVSTGRADRTVKKPAWMNPGMNTGTQPPPGGVAQPRSPLGGPGELPAEDYSNEQSLRVPLESLSDRDLHRHWGHCQYQVESLGQVLAGVQELISESRRERRQLRAFATGLLRRMNALEVSVDAVVDGCWPYRRQLTFEHEMSREARDIEQRLKGWKTTRASMGLAISARARESRRVA
jgi:RNA-directed DNA polymerase